MRSPLWKLRAPLFLAFPRHRYYFHRIYGLKCERCCKNPVPNSHVAHNPSRAAKKLVNVGRSVSSKKGAREFQGWSGTPARDVHGRAVLRGSGECARTHGAGSDTGVARGGRGSQAEATRDASSPPRSFFGKSAFFLPHFRLNPKSIS